MILADTSAWVEFDRGTGSPVAKRMRDLIAEDGPLAVTEPVIMDVLAGARTDARAIQLRRLLLRCTMLSLEPVADFEAAARIYRGCRRVGITPRGMLDCLVAAVAVRTDAEVLSCDIDLERVAQVIGLRMAAV